MARTKATAAGAALRPEERSIYEGSDDAPDTAPRWDAVSGQTVISCAEAVSRLGHALMLGRTADGYALSVTILAGAARTKKYFDDSANADAWLQSVTRIAVDGFMSMAK